MSDFVLYNYFRSSTSYRVRIALHHKGLSFEYIPVHLLSNGGEQHKAQYRSLNPIGEVPTLVHKGQAIAQSMCIIEYLDEVVPQKNLFPKDPFKKSKVRQVCENINCSIHPLQNLKTLQFLEKEFGFDQDKKNKWTHEWIDRGLIATEKILQDSAGRFAFGDDMTAADLFIVPQLFSADRFGVNIRNYSLLYRLFEECNKQDAFFKAHPYRQMDTPADLKI